MMDGDQTDHSDLSELEIMRRIIDKLPDDSRERLQLRHVVAGLSAIDTFEVLDGKTVYKTNYHDQARAMLSSLLPRLNHQHPDDPLVSELVRRYDERRSNGA